MAEGLATLTGEPVDIDAAEAAFAAAMAAPAADRPGMPAPARKPPEPDPDPEAAPHGWTYTEGEWRPKRAAGRPKKADQPRVTDAPAPKAPPAKAAAPQPAPAAPATNYAETVKQLAESVWFALAAAPVPDQAFGYKLTGLRRRLRAQAAIVEQNVDALAGGVVLIAQHNKFVGRALARVAAGEGGLWILPAGLALAPFLAATGQLWTGRLLGDEALDQVAAKVEADAQQYVQQLVEVIPPAA